MRTPHFWQRKGLISTLLLPFSALYALGFALDKRFTKASRAVLPVIAVGNLTAGGAGKTPTAMTLAAMLQQMGEVPHIVSRGYGGKARHAHRVSADDAAADVGDEALLLARAAPAWVGRDRHASIRAAKEAGATIIIADDALQHHALIPDLAILVVDLTSGFGNGRLLPAGPLRQTVSSLYEDRSIAVLAIGGDDPRQLLPQLAVHGEVWRATLTPPTDTSWLKEGIWLAFAGIAYPQKFYDTLRSCGATLAETHDFSDHRPYRRADLARLERRADRLGARLITTEKDAVRLKPSWRIPFSVLPVVLRLADPDIIREKLAGLRRSA